MKVLTEKFPGLLPVAAFFILWEAIGALKLVNPLLLPPFSKVALKIWDILLHGNLLEHITISLERAMGGFLIALCVAIPLGLLLGGWFRTIQLALEPLCDIAAQANPFILFHVVILFLGIGEAAKISVIAWVCVWPILFNTVAGVKNVDANLLKAALAFGLSKWAIFRKVVLPAAAPAIFTGLRLSAGYSFFLLIAAEMMGSRTGLGYLVLYTQESYNVELVYSAALVITLLGLSIDILLQYAQKRIIIWQQESDTY